MCKEISQFDGEPNNFVAFVLEIDPYGMCQDEPVSEDSPGPVRGAETLARRVFAPLHTTGAPALDDALFLDAGNKGASTQRLQDNNERQIVEIHHEGESAAAVRRAGLDGRKPEPQRQYLGVVKLETDAARRIRFSDDLVISPLVRVYDTAKRGDTHHADIVFDLRGFAKRESSKSLKKGVRFALLKLAEVQGLFLSPHFSGDREALQFLGTHIIE